jgi:hypothetical protein
MLAELVGTHYHTRMSASRRPTMSSVDDVVMADDPIPGVRRLTLNRPAKRKAMGIRQGMRAVSDIRDLGLRTKSSAEYLKRLTSNVGEAPRHRDGPFGDYRASDAR